MQKRSLYCEEQSGKIFMICMTSIELVEKHISIGKKFMYSNCEIMSSFEANEASESLLRDSV